MLESAKYVVDVERNDMYVEVTLIDGKKEWIYSIPKGEWSHLKLRGVNYADFLRAMVEPNLDVLKKIARLELQQVWHRSVRAMRCLCILDPSFDAPYINKNSKWQMNMVSHLNRVVGFSVIDQCDDQWSLMTYGNKLRALR
jgi:hypothetical protein